jgi:chitin disaccharide deacetylase
MSKLLRKIKLHADDIGATKEVNRNILKSIDNGVVKSVSIIVNGYALDHAVQAIRARKINSYIHFNLTFGKPLSNNILVKKYLCDKDGFFNTNFVKLLFYNFYLSKDRRENLKKAIKLELEKQLNLYLDKTRNNKIFVDGHEHFHLIPIISDIILSLNKRYNIFKIRIPKEKINITDLLNIFNIKNIIKVLVLNTLSWRFLRKIKFTNIKYNKFFIGVLNTNNMNIKNIKKSIKILNIKDLNELMILVHPGYASKKEKKYFKKAEWNFFNSYKRLNEYNLSVNFKNIKL